MISAKERKIFDMVIIKVTELYFLICQFIICWVIKCMVIL